MAIQRKRQLKEINVPYIIFLLHKKLPVQRWGMASCFVLQNSLNYLHILHLKFIQL